MNASLVNLTRGSVLAGKVRYCNRLHSRLIGLLGTQEPLRDEACWLIPCKGIHTFGMKYTIDAYFLDGKNVVIAAVKGLKPNRLSKIYAGAHSVLEFPADPGRDCHLGDRLSLEVAR